MFGNGILHTHLFCLKASLYQCQCYLPTEEVQQCGLFRAQSFNQFLQDWVKRHPSHGLKIMASRDKCVSMITPLRGFSLLLPRRDLLRKNRTAAKKKVCGKVRLLPHGFGLGVPHNHVLNCTSSIPYAPVFKNVVYLTAMDVTCPLNSFHTFWT